MTWSLYIILCSDDTLYTGITIDVERRLQQHAGGVGAKYFRGRRPLRMIYIEGGHTHSSAARREVEVKRLSRAGKMALIAAAESLSDFPSVP